MAQTVGQVDIRGENISKIVTGFALQEYIMKQLTMVQTSNKWKETYFVETAADLTTNIGNDIEGIPRLANFPHAEVSWTEKSSVHIKHGAEGVISWEDLRTNDVDVMARTLLRMARAVTRSVDRNIWDVLTEERKGSEYTINTLAIAAGSEWDSLDVAAQNPIQNILDAKTEISIDNYNPDKNGFLVLNPKDYANLLGNANIRNAGQFYTDDVTKNGRVGHILGLKVIVSNSVTPDFAAVIVAKECATWKSVAALTTKTIEEPGINMIIRTWEMGVCQLKNPECVCLISNTQRT